MKMKFLNPVSSVASIVLLGAGLAVAQCSSAPAGASSTTSSVTENDRTPSALNPQTNSPDSTNRFNPVTGQNADSQRNPNAVPTVDHGGSTGATGQGATVTQDPGNSNSVIVTQDSNQDSTSDTAIDTPAITPASDDDSGSQE